MQPPDLDRRQQAESVIWQTLSARLPGLPFWRAGAAGAPAADELHVPLLPSSQLSAGDGARVDVQQLLHALWPLTHALEQEDLQPHADEQARSLYQTLVKGVSQRPWWALDPEGAPRLAWDVLLLVLTGVLVLYVPLLIAFYSPVRDCSYFSDAPRDPVLEPHAPPPSRVGTSLLSLTNAAFLLDILLNVATGVRAHNPATNLKQTSYHWPTIVRTYARTWLLLDVVSCLPIECLGLPLPYNLGHLNRLLKALGLRRRAHGDPWRVVYWVPWVRDNFAYSMRLVVLSSSALLLALHYWACALWLVLRVQGFPDATWPVQLALLEDHSVGEWWTWSLFSAVSGMIGLGYGSFPPVTYAEAGYWVVEMLTMAAAFAVVNGFVLSAILDHLAAQSSYKARMLHATREMERRRLPESLKQRVQAYLKLKHTNRHVQTTDGARLSDLDPGLRLQVAVASVGCHLERLPPLRGCRQLLQRVALLVQHDVAAEGQLIAVPGSLDSHLYILAQGYADLFCGDALVDTLVSGDSFGQAALLPVPRELPPRLGALWGRSRMSRAAWPTLFTVRALSNCSLLVLEGRAFGALAAEYGDAARELAALGEAFAAALERLPQLEALWAQAAAFDPLARHKSALGEGGAGKA